MQNIINVPSIDSFSCKATTLITSRFPITEEVSLLIPKSAVRLLLGKRVFDLKAGDAVIVLPFTVCEIAQKDRSFDGYALSFPEQALRALSPSLLLRFSEGALSLAVASPSKERLFSITEQMCCQTNADIYNVLEVFSILEKRTLPQMDDFDLVPLPMLLRRAISYLYEHPYEEITTDALAARYDVSVATLTRAFRLHLATTPLKYHVAVRMARQASDGFLPSHKK